MQAWPLIGSQVLNAPLWVDVGATYVADVDIRAPIVACWLVHYRHDGANTQFLLSSLVYNSIARWSFMKCGILYINLRYVYNEYVESCRIAVQNSEI